MPATNPDLEILEGRRWTVVVIEVTSHLIFIYRDGIINLRVLLIVKKRLLEASPGHFGTIDEEEQLVQMAVQRSLVEYGGAEHLTQRQYSLAKRGVVEARPGEYVDPEEAMMQEAIAESFQQESGLSDLEQQYLKALELSREELAQEEERQKKEEEELERVLKLSLVEN
ncbi:hypothetical protein ACTXT7_007401 [Hymenolepis weldensis]